MLVIETSSMRNEIKPEVFWMFTVDMWVKTCQMAFLYRSVLRFVATKLWRDSVHMISALPDLLRQLKPCVCDGRNGIKAAFCWHLVWVVAGVWVRVMHKWHKPGWRLGLRDDGGNITIASRCISVTVRQTPQRRPCFFFFFPFTEKQFN